MRKILTCILLATTLHATAQRFPLAEAPDHYKTLALHSSSSVRSRAWMDTVRYPSTEYGNSIVYLLVTPHYLSQASISEISNLVRFPANSSDQVRKELDYLLDLQNKRTPEQVKRVEFLGNIEYWPSIDQVTTHPGYKQNLMDLFFEASEVYGRPIPPENFPKVSTLLKGVMNDMRIMEFTIKYAQLRPRPYHLETALKPLARMSSPSYVSGHTLWAFLQAFVWSELAPEKHREFVQLAEEIRRSREIMGIHFPSDNEAARQVAFQMLTECFKNEAFKNDLGEASREWRAKHSQFVN
jgi:acid phosphatase (class A)